MTIHLVPSRGFEPGQTEIRPILLQRSDSSATSEGIKCCWPGYDLTPALSVASERTGATPTRLLAESSRDTVGPSTEVHASLGPRSQHHRSQAFLPCDTSNTLQAVGLHHQLLTRILFLVYCVNVAKICLSYIQYLSKESDILFCSITHTNLGQLSKPGTVLKSAHPEDSKTVPES